MKNKKFISNMSFANRMVSAFILGVFLAMAVVSFSPVGAIMLFALSMFMPFTKLPVGILGEGAAGAGALSEEDKLLNKLKLELKSILDGEIGTTKARMEAIEKLLAGINNEALKTEVANLGVLVNALKEAKPMQHVVSNKSVAEQLKAFATGEKTKDKWEAWKRGDIDNLEIPLTLKSAGTMLESNALGGSAYLPSVEMVPGITDIARTKPLIEQYANTSNTNSAVIVWVNKTNPEGTVVMLAEGEVKTLIDFNLETETSTAKKAPGKIKVSTEMLDDFEFMAREIEGELRYQVDKAVDEQLLSGTGLTVYLKGITEYAGGYVLTTIEAENANNSDAIMAAATQIVSLDFQASHAFVNPIDAANMKLTKDDNGQYVIPPFQAANGLSIAGLTIVESNKIPVGYVLVADMSKYHVRNYKPFTVTYGHTGDDFERNLVTILGERRLHAYASDNNTGAFVYDTFANIKTALEPAP